MDCLITASARALVLRGIAIHAVAMLVATALLTSEACRVFDADGRMQRALGGKPDEFFDTCSTV